MAKKKSAPKHVEPEDESQDIEEEPETEEEQDDEPEAARPASPTMSKADACRAALAAGIDTAEKAMEFTRSKFGVEIKATDFTLYKSKQKKQGEPKGRPGRKPKAAAAPAVDGYLAPPPKPAPTGGSDLLDAMEAMKPLVASLGKEQVKRIVDLLG